MAVAVFKRFLLVLVFDFALQVFLFEAVASSLKTSMNVNFSSALPLLQNGSNNSTSEKKSILFHKCCDLGQVYHSYSADIGSNRCLNSSVNSHPSSLLIENPQPLMWTTDQNPLPYNDEDFEFVTGFPSRCDRNNLDYLDPDEKIANRFYLTASGHLVFPHLFMFLNPKDYCIEEYFVDENFNKASRTMYFCPSDLNAFPNTAINEDGKLQLDFIDSTASKALLSIVGRTVVRKCCDINQVYSIQNKECISYKQELLTNFFEDLPARENETFFFRIGFPNCFDMTKTRNFQLTSSGSLQVKPTDRQELSDQLFSADDNYCVDNLVTADFLGLPKVTMQAFYCPRKPTELESFQTVHPIDSGTVQDPNNEEHKQFNVSKCCALDSVVVEGTCQPLTLIADTLNPESIATNALNFYMLESYNLSSFLTPHVSFSCGFEMKYPLIRASENDSNRIVWSFEENDKLSLSRHIFLENYWDFNLKLKTFCVDLEFFRNVDVAIYQPKIYYCLPQYHVSGHYPIILGVSSVALLATAILYFLVPASGSAKFVTSIVRPSKRRNIMPNTMATMLTGRILLCHILTLSVAFITLSISQANQVYSATTCTVVGFIIYGASIASFSWLTVYCFDYCRIFREPFKVSDELLFIPYSLFGWGIPLLALVVASVAQFRSTNYGISSTFNPNMGLINCWFAGSTTSLIFFYIPISSLMLLNIIFFLGLLFNSNLMYCWKRNQSPNLRTNRTKPKVSKAKQDIKMAIKLFFITGIPWVFEIVAWLPTYLPDVQPILKDNLKYFIEVSNLLNSLRGVIIFVIFVLLQRHVRRYLWHRFKLLFSSRDNSKMNSRTNANQRISAWNRESTTSTSQLSTSEFNLSFRMEGEEQDSTNKPASKEDTQL